MSNDFAKASPAQQAIVMWVIWFAILSGLFIIATFAAPKPDPDQEVVALSMSPMLLGGIGAVLVGLVVRFLVIPKLPSLTAKLPAMVMGIALCESAGIIGMFAVQTSHVPERNLLFSLAVAGVLVSAPIYTRRSKDASPFHQP